eukprot:Gb_25593 [translate_table: standard]
MHEVVEDNLSLWVGKWKMFVARVDGKNLEPYESPSVLYIMAMDLIERSDWVESTILPKCKAYVALDRYMQHVNEDEVASISSFKQFCFTQMHALNDALENATSLSNYIKNQWPEVEWDDAYASHVAIREFNVSKPLISPQQQWVWLQHLEVAQSQDPNATILDYLAQPIQFMTVEILAVEADLMEKKNFSRLSMTSLKLIPKKGLLSSSTSPSTHTFMPIISLVTQTAPISTSSEPASSSNPTLRMTALSGQDARLSSLLAIQVPWDQWLASFEDGVLQARIDLTRVTSVQPPTLQKIKESARANFIPPWRLQKAITQLLAVGMPLSIIKGLDELSTYRHALRTLVSTLMSASDQSQAIQQEQDTLRAVSTTIMQKVRMRIVSTRTKVKREHATIVLREMVVKTIMDEVPTLITVIAGKATDIGPQKVEFMSLMIGSTFTIKPGQSCTLASFGLWRRAIHCASTSPPYSGDAYESIIDNWCHLIGHAYLADIGHINNINTRGTSGLVDPCFNEPFVSTYSSTSLWVSCLATSHFFVAANVTYSSCASPGDLEKDVCNFTLRQTPRTSPGPSIATTANQASTLPWFGPVLRSPEDPHSKSAFEGLSSRDIYHFSN